MPTIGDVIAAKYRLEKVAGEGGMGIVYAAEHLVLRQRVAVKVLLPEAALSEAVVERFSREAQAAARIQSDHVARVLDAGSLVNGSPFLVMEYLEGCDLEELLELNGKLPVAEAIDYAIQACEALAHAHAVGIIHRDLKPANLFLACRPDGGNQIKMLDFGISKSMKSKPSEKRLTGQHVLGSPVYMSPEQLRNSKTIDARADIWSLGVVVYEMLTGTPPFDADGVGEIFAKILGNEECEPLHVRNPKVPRELSDVIAKCLRREPSERWEDAAQVASALRPFGSGAWNDVIPRIEQVLARAKLLSPTHTPIEARLVVDAIAAAAERARTGIRSAPPPASAPSQPKPTVLDATSTASEAAAFARPRWVRFAYVIGAVVAIGAAALISVAKTSGATFVNPLGADGVLGGPSPSAAASGSTEAPGTASSARDNASSPTAKRAAVASSSAMASAAPKKTAPSSKPAGRPKFLKTRE
jgi:serine/threonine-protein kinase